MYIKTFHLFYLLLLFCTKSLCKRYNNYTLYRGMPVNEDHLNFFKNLSSVYEVNFWRFPSTVYRPVEFVVSPSEKEQFLKDAKINDVYLTTLIHDLQGAFDRQTVKSYIRRRMDSFDWQSYFRLKDIYGWLHDLHKKYPDEMTLFSIGRTYEDRPIYGVQIVLKGCKKRSKIIIEGGIHAREWISISFATYMINEILSARAKNNQYLLDVAIIYEWFFVPVLNPDGYEYSHTQDRLWRKNRVNNHGVDINRNFGYRFGTVGVSLNKQSEIYCGPYAFSEKESQAMRKFIDNNNENLEYYLGFHSYGQFMIIPYAHSSKHVDNFNEVRRMGYNAAKNISQRYGTQYTIGTAYDTVGYKTSGISGCWVKKTYRVPYVLTFELRDNGRNGFALPPKYIYPTCQETLDGVVSLLTPRTKLFTKMPELDRSAEDELNNKDQKNTILDALVIVCNVLLFIIVRFD